ncbi:MAG: TonB-dependent receptor [Verrucomicrobia bacterium]|nr:TonB-dependent receptor [Verrucomicrobiota bacterium]
MKTLSRYAMVAASIIVGLNVTPLVVAAASVPTTGEIEGRVQNQVTGRYLNNSLVQVKGTDLSTFTDESGRYRLPHVPAGVVALDVVYTGLERQNVTVNLAPGQVVTLDVSLSPPGGATVKMDAFLVASTRDMDQATITINEQRFAANLKTVVPTGDLSEHGDGNIAEFLKFAPGISGNHGQRGDIGALSVRGFPSELTQITQDGADAANAPLSGNGREVSLRSTMSITNLARIEVTKVPTSATGADTMAGSVNLISKSAFEAPRREFRYTGTITGEHDSILDMFRGKKKYGLWEAKRDYFAWPTFTFSFTDPVSSKFGYTISGKYHNAGLPTHERGKTYNANSPTYRSTPGNPLYVSHLDNWWGQLQERRHLDATADWRVTRHSILSVGARIFKSSSNNGIYRASWSAGTNSTPTVANGVSGSYGPDFTIGATGRGVIQFQNNNQMQLYHGASGNLRYTFDNGDWKADLKTSQSTGQFRYRTMPSHGQMRNVTVQSTIPLRVEHREIDPIDGPRRTLVFDNNNQPIDTSTADFLSRYTAISSATMLEFDVSDDVSTYNVDLRKALHVFGLASKVQLGAARKTKERDTWNRQNYVLRYNGPGGNLSPAPFLTEPIALYPGDDGQKQVVVSPYLPAEAFKKDPGLFYELPADRVNRERERINRSENIQEDVDAFYLQAETRLLRNRLKLLTGVRYERTKVKGVGALNTPDAVWQRNRDGSYVLNASGARVRNPAAGAAGSMEELAVTWRERAAVSNRTYDGFYPSVHATYNFTERLQARAAFAQTYGRPDFSFIIPNVVVNEFSGSDGDVTGGRLTMRNPGLLPWSADNYDLTLEYYTDQGGVFSAGVFRKQVANFFGNVDRLSTPQELSDAGVVADGQTWETRTTINIGSARIDGIELSFNQSLAPLDRWLAGWGSSLRLFGNITKITIGGARQGDFQGFLPTSANWGVYITRKRVRAALKWNHSSDRPGAALATFGPNGENFNVGMTHLDVNLSYSFRPNLAVFVNLKNVTRDFRIQAHRSDLLPKYAEYRYPNRLNGIATELGINGSF